MQDQAIYLLFILSISLHNMEEALWLPAWSKYAKKFHKETDHHEFRFAVLMITVFAVLVTAAFLFFPQINLIKYAYFGFLGAMMINVFAPHLMATIVLKRYAPGLITGALLNLPINGMIIYKSINSRLLDLTQIFFSTAIVGVILIIILPLLFRMGKCVRDYK